MQAHLLHADLHYSYQPVFVLLHVSNTAAYENC